MNSGTYFHFTFTEMHKSVAASNSEAFAVLHVLSHVFIQLSLTAFTSTVYLSFSEMEAQ